jgi:hypothetical protein
MIAACRGSLVGGVPSADFGVVADGLVSEVPGVEALVGVVVVPDDFGVGAVSGIFGGLVAPVGSSGLTVVGVPGAVVVAVGVVAVAPGVVGVDVRGVVGVVVGGTVACATVVTTERGLGLPLLSAAYAAVAAPIARTAAMPRIAAAERQLGARVVRLSGVPAPHCRHQSWPGVSGEPQFAQARSGAGGPSGPAPGIC